MKLSSIPSLSPELFFRISHECLPLKKGDSVIKKYYQMKKLASLERDEWVDWHMAWTKDGLHLFFHLQKPLEKVESDYRKGDTIELFIDTRDNKQKNIVSRFCHHFVIYPEKMNGVYAKEVTRFRGEDMHTLASKESFEVIVSIQKKSYSLQVRIKAEALHGYDPEQFQHLGFCYRINTPQMDPQGLYTIFDAFSFEKHPSLWSSLILKKDKR